MSIIVDLISHKIKYLICEEGGGGMQFNSQTTGAVIRKLRIQKGMTQDLLSGLAGIARTHLTMIENGTKQPNFETIWKIASALEMKPSELVAEIEKEISE